MPSTGSSRQACWQKNACLTNPVYALGFSSHAGVDQADVSQPAADKPADKLFVCYRGQEALTTLIHAIGVGRMRPPALS